MSFSFRSELESSMGSVSQNLYSDDERSRNRPHRDSGSSVGPNLTWEEGEQAARSHANSVHTSNTSVSSENTPLRRKLRDEWDLLVILGHELPNDKKRIDVELKCSSVILCDCSRRLKAMIGTEGRTKRIGGGPQRSLEIIVPQDYTAEAVDVLICSMHHFNTYRRIESFGDLMHLAIACWSLECSTNLIEILGNTLRMDLQPPRPQALGGVDRQDSQYVGWVFVALVFGWDDIFRSASREVVMGGRWAIENAGDYLPNDLRRAIKEKRAETIAGVISFVRKASQTYLHSDGMFPGVICTFLKTLDERLQHFRIQLIPEAAEYDTGGVPSARDLITHLKGLPGIPPEYRGEVTDSPVSPTAPSSSGLPPPPPSPSHNSNRSGGSSSAGGGAPGPAVRNGDLEQWRSGCTSDVVSSSIAKMWHKRRRVIEWVNIVCRPSRIDGINDRSPTQQEGAGAQEWGRVRAEFLERLEDEVEGFGVMEMEKFRELRESHIFEPASGRDMGDLAWFTS